LKLTNVLSISGDASIALIRGEPRMGYELNIKMELTGVDETYFTDF
jgi:activator of HSP90 ATPase